MLCEIYCEKFHQNRIFFHNGLNVVLGTPTADNSIGKSTLMLIVDFAFGGNTYTDATDIIKNVGEHSIGFKFHFGDKDFYFSRSISDRNTVWKCDASYTAESSITTADYCEWLARQYGVTMHKLSFRDAVGRYIRVYGKDNYDEKRPLHVVSSEAGGTAAIALLKLFDRYRVIDDLDSRAKESKENLRVYTQAQGHNFIAKISKRQFSQNERDILSKTNEIEALSAELNKGLLDLDAVTSEQAIAIKRQLSHARRIRSKLKSQASTLDENGRYTFSETSETFTELARFFPQTNFRHIDEVENFHNQIAGIFHAELQKKKQDIDKQLIDIEAVITELEEQLDSLVDNPNLSKLILQKHADTVRMIDRMKRENEAYEATQELRRVKAEDEASLTRAKAEQFGIVEKMVNMEMDRINSLLYTEKHNSPILHFSDSNYTFHTPDDTGTGIAYKGLVVFDLAVLHLTNLPILAHDSLILKQISDDAIEHILQQYAESGKQVIISLDKQDSYSDKTAAILDENSVVKLAPGGEELFGRSWGKHST